MQALSRGVGRPLALRGFPLQSQFFREKPYLCCWLHFLHVRPRASLKVKYDTSFHRNLLLLFSGQWKDSQRGPAFDPAVQMLLGTPASHSRVPRFEFCLCFSFRLLLRPQDTVRMAQVLQALHPHGNPD